MIKKTVQNEAEIEVLYVLNSNPLNDKDFNKIKDLIIQLFE